MSAFTERLGGEWRDVAPTVAEIEAHAGWWWLAWERDRPVLRAPLVCDGGDGQGAYVWRGVMGTRIPADEWDEGRRDDWRSGALVCPCDGEGVPVPWPVVEVTK